MRGSPFVHFFYVLMILAVMGAGVMFVSSSSDTPEIVENVKDDSSDRVDVKVMMVFSHQPLTVKVQGLDQANQPVNNQLTFNLNLPKDDISELLVDIVWNDKTGARYFTDITIRQDGKKDQKIIFSDQLAEFSDVLTINTNGSR